MGNTWLIVIAIVVFALNTFLYWKLTHSYAKKETGEKMWNQWTSRTFYWTGALWYSGGATVLVLFLLKWANVLTF